MRFTRRGRAPGSPLSRQCVIDISAKRDWEKHADIAGVQRDGRSGAFVEDGRPPSRVAEVLAGELQTMAGWLGLGGVAVGKRGNLAGALSAAVERR